MQILNTHLKIAKRGFVAQMEETKINAYCSMFICFQIRCRLEGTNTALLLQLFFYKVHHVIKDSLAQWHFTGKRR